ncbi:hypothetical protein L1281_001437 [Neisseria sp. HSC-16F19]|nr:hypothetical protein [Neisseria sp. HSC-16F19]MCP2040847.1 hypothetical protein [Neisseria sp. HSC-16F19]
MKPLVLAAAAAAVILSGCAATPEQIAVRQAAEAQAQHRLHLALLAQCDPEAAALAPSPSDSADDAQAAKRAQAYREKVSDPVFQRCYRLAWENHLNQARLQAAAYEMQRREFWHDGFFHPRWFGCRGYRSCYW